jgi:PAS domain S-box-containing protein
VGSVKVIGDGLLRALSEASGGAVVLFDSKGNILEADRNFLKMLKYDEGHAEDITWDALTPPDYHEIDHSKIQELLASGTSGVWRKELIAKDGTYVPVLMSTACLNSHDDRFIGVVLDASQLDQADQDPRKLAGRLLHHYDEERRRIARELHDTTAQNLAALSMNLVMLSSAMSDPQRARSILDECSVLTEECLKEIRSLSYVLYPPLLDELGLESALRAFVGMYGRRTGVTVDLVFLGLLGRLDPQVELGVFRVAQESLFNVQRHSGSTRAEVQVERGDGAISLTIRDWGKGVGEGVAHPDSIGIAGMRERVRLLGGRLHIGPADPGTVVRAVFPTER